MIEGDRPRPVVARWLLRSLASGVLFAATTGAASAQETVNSGGSAVVGPGSREIPGRVLGALPLTDADSMVQSMVDRLDFGSYKGLIRGLAQFGDRRQGTEDNALANDWIEAELQSWGYTTERLDYVYQGETRNQVYATKVGRTIPEEMVILGAHMDGIGGGEAVNDNASGTALVMEIARVLASSDIETERSVRFVLWNNEETGLNGARAYVEQRVALQGIESPAGSGRYPEPRWVAMIQHDKVLYDHGNPVENQQAWNADVDIEFQLASGKWEESAELGVLMINANRMFAGDYPAVLSNAMSNTDSTPFMDQVASVSVRENRRLYEIGWRGPAGYGARGSDPNWHQPTDLFVRYSDWDFLLGFNAMQTTLGATAKLVGARVVP